MTTPANRQLAPILTVQGLRACAVLLVMFLHLRDLERVHQTAPLLPDWTNIGHAGVDLFFVISGFIMVLISQAYPANWRAALNFLYHRWMRIYPNYWFWFLITLILYCLTPSWLRLEPGQLTHLIESFFLIPTWTPQLVPVSWTLKYELYFYLVFSFLILFPPQARMYLLLIWAAYMLAGQIYCYQPPSINCARNFFLTIHPLAFEFLFGALVALIYLRGQRGKPFLLLFLGSFLLVGGLIYYQLSGIALDDNAWYRVILFGLPAALILLGCVVAERDRGLIPPAWLITLGNASYSIYLSHFLLFDLLFQAIGILKHLPPGTVVGAVFISSTGLGVLAYRWTEKPLLQSIRRFQPPIDVQAKYSDNPAPSSNQRIPS